MAKERHREKERQKGRNTQPPFTPSVGSLCHFCVTPTHLSYIGFPFLKLPPPPCAVLLVNIPALWFASGESTGKGRFFGLGAAGSQGQHCHLCPRGALQKKKRQNRQMLKALRRSRVVSPWSMGTEKEWCLRNPICQVLRPLYLTTPLSLIVQLERRWSLPHDFVEQNILFQVAACKRMFRDMGVS